MQRPALSVVIVTWNSRTHLGRCLSSVEGSCRELGREVLVIDNHSGDGTAELVETEFPGVALVRNDENLGFARAANQGLRRARGRYCLLLNPDTEVVGDALAATVEFLEKHPRVGIVGCRVENPDGSLQRGCRRSLPTPRGMFFRLTGLSALFPRHPTLAEYTMTHRSAGEAHPVEAVSGSFLAVRREVMDEVGLLDESFFMYGEDLDWCKRALEAGWEVYYFPGARVIHFLGQSSRLNRRRAVRSLHEAGEIYYRKHLAPGSHPLLNWLILGALRARAALLLLGVSMNGSAPGEVIDSRSLVSAPPAEMGKG